MPASVIRGVDHIGITVSDMDRAIRLFRDGLGAQVTEPHLYDDPKIARAIGLEGVKNLICQADLGGRRFELLQYVSPAGRPAPELKPCDSGQMHIALEVDGIDEAVERLRQAGFEPAGPVQHGLGGASLSAIYCYGFDGLVLELIDYGRRP